jgi:ribonuclease HI
VVKDEAGILQEKRGKYLGAGTNNEAEYMAVIEAWDWVNEFRSQNLVLQINFHLDSKLVVNQINRNFKVKEPRLVDLIGRVRMGETFNDGHVVVTYKYVPRDQNTEADLVVNETLDKASQ